MPRYPNPSPSTPHPPPLTPNKELERAEVADATVPFHEALHHNTAYKFESATHAARL